MTTQEFLEEYLPNYHNNDTIAYLDDLYKLMDEEYEEGDDVHTLLVKEFGGNFKQAYPLIEQRILEVEYKLLVEAIKNMKV